MDNNVRSAIGAALDHPFADEAFELVDMIEESVRDDDPAPESTRHEVASEMTDLIVSRWSTRGLAILWAALGANDAAVERFGESSGSTLDRMTSDLFCVVEDAVHAALVAYAEEVEDDES